MGREIFELAKAWIAVVVAFTILYREGNIYPIFLIMFFTVGIGFLGHELMHKFVALRYGKRAEFSANNHMLLIMIVFSFFGFILAAPGGVYIKGILSRKENGIISAAGPAANIVMALLFYFLSSIFSVAYYGFTINSWLAFFNMLPFHGFDGSKVLAWNKTAYFMTIAVSVILVGITYFG